MRIYQEPTWCGALLALAMTCVMGGTAAAQWLSLPLPGTPRTADGKPNLTAPTPRTADGKPDLSGIWHADNPRYNENLVPVGSEAPMLPWAVDLYKHRVETRGYDRPGTRCMPHGVPDAMTVAGLPFKTVQTPTELIVLFEEFHVYRQIHTDGRKLPVDPDAAWYGYSVGRWEGDTFVVDTAGFKGGDRGADGTWLDNSGHPHTDALRLTERYRRINFGRMDLTVTVDDPKAYTRTWTSDTIHLLLQPDTEVLEHLCENDRDRGRLQEIYRGPEQAAPSTTGKQ
jgi:hypothetical protein